MNATSFRCMPIVKECQLWKIFRGPIQCIVPPCIVQYITSDLRTFLEANNNYSGKNSSFSKLVCVFSSLRINIVSRVNISSGNTAADGRGSSCLSTGILYTHSEQYLCFKVDGWPFIRYYLAVLNGTCI